MFLSNDPHLFAVPVVGEGKCDIAARAQEVSCYLLQHLRVLKGNFWDKLSGS